MPKCQTCGKDHTQAEFYSSINSHCKEHWRERVKANRKANIEHYREFDRKRASNPKRIAARKAYQETESFATSHKNACRKYQSSNPSRINARSIVNHAIRSGMLSQMPCFCCGDKAEAHHPDYSSPLDVVWLCDSHHKQLHAEHRLFLRQSLIA